MYKAIQRLLILLPLALTISSADDNFPSMPGPSEDFLTRRGNDIPSAKFNKLLSREAHGVVKIGLTLENGEQIFGTGTFLSGDGHLISNMHVLKPLRDNPKVKVTYTLKNGTILNSSTFIKCDDQPGIDLCVVRLNVRPRYWFPLKIKLPPTYTSLFMIGNPSHKDFDMLSGRLFLPASSKEKNVRRLEVSVPIRPGFSGGPIFDDEGKLVCIATELRYSQTLIGISWQPDPNSLQYFCIEASIISEYIKK